MQDFIHSRRASFVSYDSLLIWLLLLLVGFSLVMVYSASIATAEASHETHHQASYYLARHGIYIVLAMAFAWGASLVPISRWQEWAPYFFLIALLLLFLVLIPGVGVESHGSRRWIRLGFVTVQPAEIMKLAAVVYVADYIVRKALVMHSIVKSFLPMLVVMLVVGFVLLRQPDFGSFMVIAFITLSMLWLGGIDGRIFSGMLVLLILGAVLLILGSPYRLQRILGFMDPWADPMGSGYQLSHALIAFGRGEWFGVGLGRSVEKLLYLPEAHTDFLLAVIAEELGFVGVLTLILALTFLVFRAFRIGKEALAHDRGFATLLAQGIGTWVGTQMLVNVGVNMGILPTKGLTLPLMSYGGNSLLVVSVAMAILIRIDWENRRLDRGIAL